jgi:AcrR family transcriptional regulator
MPNDLNSVKSGAEPSSEKRASYHHGNLRTALIEAAEAILQERGATGFSLREAARRAGVSPGAPAHHFGDARGLLTAVAAGGFVRLAAQLRTASEAAPADGRLEAIAVAYLQFARENKALFGIMWLRDLLDQSDPAYLSAGRDAFNVLEQAATGPEAPIATAPRIPDPSVIAAWSLVHGLARLTLDGALDAVPSDFQSKVLRLAPRVLEDRRG